MSGGKSPKVKETAEEKELASIGAERWARYQAKWKPVRDAFIADVRDGSDERKTALSMSGANTASAFSRNRKAVEDKIGGLGSGRFNLGMGGYSRDQAKSQGLSLVDTAQAAADTRLSTMEALTRMGMGQASGAIRGLSDVANVSARQAASDAVIAAQDRAAMGDAVGGLAALGYYGAQKSMGGDAMSSTGIVEESANQDPNQWNRKLNPGGNFRILPYGPAE